MGWQESQEVQQGERQSPLPFRGRNNPRHQHTLQATQMESSFAEKNPAVLVVSQLNMNQEGAVAAQPANGDLGCSSSRSTASGLRELILAPHSALVKPPGGLTSSELHGRRDLDTLETAPQGLTQMVRGWKHLSYNKRLKEQELFNLERRLRGISSTVTQKPKGRVQTGRSQALSRGAHWQDKRQWANNARQEVPSEHQEILFHCEGYQALAQAARRDCGVSILGKIQKLSGHSIGQPAPGAWLGAWTRRLLTDPSTFNHSTSLWKSTIVEDKKIVK